MKSVKLILLASFCAMVGGCFDAHHEKLVGPYILIAVDTDQQMSVAYVVGGGLSVGRILPVVFAVGYDERYIVAKRHPDGDRAITQFYYLDIAKDSETGYQFKAVTGPLKEDEFSKEKARLGLPEFKTTLDYLE